MLKSMQIFQFSPGLSRLYYIQPLLFWNIWAHAAIWTRQLQADGKSVSWVKRPMPSPQGQALKFHPILLQFLNQCMRVWELVCAWNCLCAVVYLHLKDPFTLGERIRILSAQQINENALALLMSGHLHFCIWQMILFSYFLGTHLCRSQTP